MATKPHKTLDPDALQRQLERDLDLIRKYRELQARYGGEAPNGATASIKAAPERGANSLVGTIEANLSETWQRAAHYEEKARAVRPGTNAGAVRSTLRRLVSAGVAERRGSKASGVVEYRRKTA